MALVTSGGRRALSTMGLTPDEEESLVRKATRAGLSGLGMAGNLLDVPGSVLRDLLTWLPGGPAPTNPLDQLLSPLSSDNRTSGRQLLEGYGLRSNRETGMGGWLSDPGEGVRDVAGFAADVALDPLTWIGLGGLGRAGGAAKKSGLLDDVTRVASKKADLPIGAIGPRQARLTTSLDDLIEHSLDPNAAASRVQTAIDPQQIGQTLSAAERSGPVGGLANVQPPFMDPVAMLGTGEGAQMTAAFLDKWSPNPFELGSVYRNSTAGRAIGGLMDATRQGRMREATPYAQGAFRAITDAQAETKGMVTEWANTLKKLDVTDSESAKALRASIEGVAGGRDFGGVADAVKQTQARDLQELVDLGAPAFELEDEIEYGARFLNLPKKQKGSAPLSGRDPSDIGRLDVLKGFRGGTTGTRGLEEILTSPAIDAQIKLLESIPSGRVKPSDIATNIEGVLRTQYANDIVPTYHARDAKGHFLFEGDITKSRAQLASGAWTPDRSAWVNVNDAGQIVESLTPVMKDRFKEFARYLVDHPNFRESGMFTNHPLADFAVKHDIVGKKKAVFQQAYEFLNDFAQPGDAGPTAGGLLKHVGLTTDRALENLAAKKGITLSGDVAERAEQLAQLKDLRIPKDAYDDFVREAPKLQFTPALQPLVKFADSVSNLFKASVLSWPATKVRDIASGLFQSFQGGNLKGSDALAANRLFKGQVVEGLVDNPAAKAWLAERGLPLTDENASEAMRLLLAKHLPGRANPHFDVADTIRNPGDLPDYAGGLDEILDLIPGGRPKTEAGWAKEMLGTAVPRLQGDASLNPLSKDFWTQLGTVRGVGGATESTFGPVAAAEMAGKRTDFTNRAAPFLNLTGKGVDPAEAMRQVNASQVNYDPRTFTPAERVLKMLFPFYSFTSRQVPFVGKTLTEAPGGGMGQTIRAINAGRDSDELVPEHIADTAAIPLPARVSDGTKRYLTGLGMMMEDPLQLFGGPRSSGLEVLSRLNPAIKGPLEWATGQSFFQKGPQGGRAIDDLDPTLGRILANVSGQEQAVKTPQWLEALLGNSPLTRVLTTTRQMTDKRKTPGDKAWAALTGVRVSDVSPAAQDAILRQQLDTMIRELGGKSFVKTYFAKEDLAAMDAQQQTAAIKLQALMNTLANRAKSRREAKK